MAFKLTNPPYKVNQTPVYHVDMEEGVMGKANNNLTIIINKDVAPCDIPNVIAHEEVHIDQMKRGDLDYDDDYVSKFLMSTNIMTNHHVSKLISGRSKC